MNYNTNLRINTAVNEMPNNPAKEYTIDYFRNVAKEARVEIFKATEEAERAKKDLFNIYATNLATEKASAIDAALTSRIISEKAKLFDIANKIMSEKRKRFKEVALKAPTEEQVRMLQSLQIRSNTLTAEEVALVAESMADNHQALRTLAAIANTANINIVVPASTEQAEANFSEVEEYLKNMINVIEAPRLNYIQSEFYFDGNFESGYYSVVRDAMDKSAFVAVQEKPKSPIEALEKAAEEATTAKNLEKSKRIQKFIEENDARLFTEDERLERDINNVLREAD